MENLENLKTQRTRLIDSQRSAEDATKAVAHIEPRLEEVLGRNPSRDGGHGVRLQYGIVVDRTTLRERACAFVADETNRWRENAAPLLAEYDQLWFASQAATAEREASRAALQEEIKRLAPI